MPVPPDADFFTRLEAALPLDDLLGWILRQHPEATEREVLTLVQKVCARDYVIRPSAREERSYTVGGQPWRTFPQSVAARPGA